MLFQLMVFRGQASPISIIIIFPCEIFFSPLKPTLWSVSLLLCVLPCPAETNSALSPRSWSFPWNPSTTSRFSKASKFLKGHFSMTKWPMIRLMLFRYFKWCFVIFSTWPFVSSNVWTRKWSEPMTTSQFSKSVIVFELIVCAQETSKESSDMLATLDANLARTWLSH